MTTTATYMPDLSRVRVDFTGFGSAVDYALVERSTDGIQWSTVRGGEQVPVTSGAGHLDDYEFVAGVLNTYRVSGVDAGPIVSVATPGATTTGNNASLTPALPATGANGLTDGDALLLFVSIRNSGSGTPNAPAGWTKVVDMANAALFTRRYTAGVTSPTVTFTGGVSNADTLAQITAFHNADPIPVVVNKQLNASAQNVALPALTVTEQAMMNLWLAWKQDDWTSAASGRGFAEIGDWSSTAGDDAAMWWEYTVQSVFNPVIGAGTLTVTGGAAAISRSAALTFRRAAYVTQQTATITPQLLDADGVERVWLKNIRLSYMNTALTDPVGYLSIKRTARAGLFSVVGRSKQIAVTDKRLGKAYTLGAHVEDWAGDERQRIDLLLASGDVLFVHVPPGKIRLPSMYVAVLDDEYDDEASIFTMPLNEVAAPAASIVGATITCADILANYATCADLLAAKATCADVLDGIGDPGNVITE